MAVLLIALVAAAVVVVAAATTANASLIAKNGARADTLYGAAESGIAEARTGSTLTPISSRSGTPTAARSPVGRTTSR